MKTKPLNAHARSLAAHKANWTRALRRAYPDGGPSLAAALPAELDREQCLRAMRRTDRVMVAHENLLSNLRAKQIRRLRELEQIEIRLGAQRREREIAATTARMGGAT